MAATSSHSTDRILNVNIGLLGHVDSGKTSLAKALSTTASTASFDKNPQSQQRGITIDLGFSSFMAPPPFPEHLQDTAATTATSYKHLQYTLVDCPGHAGLIRTIIGGAQIIDAMLLVVDAVKGVQTQTGECLVIGDITTNIMLVALNKIDQLKTAADINKATSKLRRVLSTTKFKDAPIIPVSATLSLHIDELIAALVKATQLPHREESGPLSFAVDHCFGIRGQGTVMTGTVLNGAVAVGDNVEIPSLKVVKKVKSMQMFRQPVMRAIQGDRVGICVAQFDPKLLERGFVCTPNAIPTAVYGCIAELHKIKYYRGKVEGRGSKFHVTIGHETIMADLTAIFALDCGTNNDDLRSVFSFDSDYAYRDELYGENDDVPSLQQLKLNCSNSVASSTPVKLLRQFGLIHFETPVNFPAKSLLIGSRLDSDIHSKACRLAFHGHVLHSFIDKNYISAELPRLRIFKLKSREGRVDRLIDSRNVVGKELFRKETSLENFFGLRVGLASGEIGVIESGFGKSGKFKVSFAEPLAEATQSSITTKGETAPRIYLNFKRFLFDPKKKMLQN